MKRFIMVVGALLCALTSAQAQYADYPEADERPRGSWIGNGKVIPREYIEGKPWEERAEELKRWFDAEPGVKLTSECQWCGITYTVRLNEGKLTLTVPPPNIVTDVLYCVYEHDERRLCYDLRSDIYGWEIWFASQKRWITTRSDRPTKPNASKIEL